MQCCQYLNNNNDNDNDNDKDSDSHNDNNNYNDNNNDNFNSNDLITSRALFTFTDQQRFTNSITTKFKIVKLIHVSSLQTHYFNFAEYFLSTFL